MHDNAGAREIKYYSQGLRHRRGIIQIQLNSKIVLGNYYLTGLSVNIKAFLFKKEKLIQEMRKH